MSSVREAAAALMRYGDYCEEPDSIEWLTSEAHDVAVAALEGPDAVVAVLVDTAWFDPTSESSDRAYAVAREVCADAQEPT